MKCVLDSPVFFLDYPAEGECYTTPSVVDELVDLKSKCRFDLLVSAGLAVQAPEKGDLVRVREAAQKTGDSPGDLRDRLRCARPCARTWRHGFHGRFCDPERGRRP